MCCWAIINTLTDCTLLPNLRSMREKREIIFLLKIILFLPACLQFEIISADYLQTDHFSGKKRTREKFFFWFTKPNNMRKLFPRDDDDDKYISAAAAATVNDWFESEKIINICQRSKCFSPRKSNTIEMKARWAKRFKELNANTNRTSHRLFDQKRKTLLYQS